MVECVVKDWEGKDAGTASFELKVASNDEVAAHIVHRAMVRQMNNARQGTASTKTRSEVRGGGRKPWRQKGTGRARSGSSRSPLMPGGGVIFGPKPRDYSVKMNRKERRLALRTAFQGRADEMTVVQGFSEHLSSPKTKELLAALDRWGVGSGQKVLIIVADRDDNLYLSARNVAALKLLSAYQLNVYDLLSADHLVVTESALQVIQEVYGD